MKKFFLVFLIGCVLCSPGFSQTSCTDLKVAEVEAMKTELATIRQWSDLDKNNHGVNGAYATAAQYQNDGIVAAQKKLDEFITWNQQNVGIAIINYAQANWWVGFCSQLEEGLESAAHWASVSAAHHKSREAYNVVIAAYELQAKLVQLRIKSSKCYMDAYVQP